MNNEQINSLGFITLEVLLVIGCLMTTGWLSTLLLFGYGIMPFVSIIVLVRFLIFFDDPTKYFLKSKRDEVEIDLRIFIEYKELYYRLTINDKTSMIYWVVDGIIITGCLLLYVYTPNPDFVLIILLLVMTETIMREMFITAVLENRDELDSMFDQYSKLIEHLQDENDEEDQQ